MLSTACSEPHELVARVDCGQINLTEPEFCVHQGEKQHLAHSIIVRTKWDDTCTTSNGDISWDLLLLPSIFSLIVPHVTLDWAISLQICKMLESPMSCHTPETQHTVGHRVDAHLTLAELMPGQMSTGLSLSLSPDRARPPGLTQALPLIWKAFPPFCRRTSSASQYPHLPLVHFWGPHFRLVPSWLFKFQLA